jgi:hypothetical protein
LPDPGSLLALTLALAPQLPAAAAGAGDTIATGVRACLQATVPAGIEEASLKAGGWVAYDFNGGDTSSMPLRIHSRGRGPILLTGVGAAAKDWGCHVVAPLSSTAGFAATVDGITKELGVRPTSNDPADTLWIVGDKGVLLAAAKDTKQTSVRATIVTIAEGMK